MNLDRFSQGLPDPQDGPEELPVMECAACGLEFYAGDKYYVAGGQPCCNDVDCMVKLENIEMRTA